MLTNGIEISVFSVHVIVSDVTTQADSPLHQAAWEEPLFDACLQTSRERHWRQYFHSIFAEKEEEAPRVIPQMDLIPKTSRDHLPHVPAGDEMNCLMQHIKARARNERATVAVILWCSAARPLARAHARLPSAQTGLKLCARDDHKSCKGASPIIAWF